MYRTIPNYQNKMPCPLIDPNLIILTCLVQLLIVLEWQHLRVFDLQSAPFMSL